MRKYSPVLILGLRNWISAAGDIQLVFYANKQKRITRSSRVFILDEKTEHERTDMRVSSRDALKAESSEMEIKTDHLKLPSLGPRKSQVSR
jgi:hypothetical protein